MANTHGDVSYWRGWYNIKTSSGFAAGLSSIFAVWFIGGYYVGASPSPFKEQFRSTCRRTPYWRLRLIQGCSNRLLRWNRGRKVMYVLNIEVENTFLKQIHIRGLVHLQIIGFPWVHFDAPNAKMRSDTCQTTLAVKWNLGWATEFLEQLLWDCAI